MYKVYSLTKNEKLAACSVLGFAYYIDCGKELFREFHADKLPVMEGKFSPGKVYEYRVKVIDFDSIGKMDFSYLLEDEWEYEHSAGIYVFEMAYDTLKEAFEHINCLKQLAKAP